MNSEAILMYATPVITASIGWFTNWVAVKMLFWPVKPVRMLGITIQGVFPKRQDKIAAKIGKMVAADLLNSQDLRQTLSHPDHAFYIRTFIADRLALYLFELFPEKYPITSVFFSKSRREKIHQDLMDQIDQWIPDLLNAMFTQLEQTFDVEKIISQKITQLSAQRLELMLQGILKSEFTFIEWMGAFLGGLVGVFQLIIWLVIQ